MNKKLTLVVVILAMFSMLLVGCFNKEEQQNLITNIEEISTMASTTVVISEVYYDTPGTDADEEYVELYNMSSSDIDLSGWTLSDNYSTYTLPNGTSIQGDSTIVIARTSSGFNNLFGFNPDVSGLSLALGNSGDQVILKNNSGTTIDYTAWENYASGWSISASTGKSIERNPANTDTDIEADWVSGADATPGTVTGGGSTGGTEGNIVFSEVHYDTSGTDSIEEFVELYNTGTTTIDVSSWTIADNGSTYTLPANTTIAGETTLTVAADTAGFNALFGFNPDVSGLNTALSNSGDKLTLKDDTGAEVDFVSWENYTSGWSISASTGKSLDRNPVNVDTNTESDWISNATPTPAGVNGETGTGDPGDPGTGEEPGGSTGTGENPAPGVMKVHFIDVGQGDCILVQAPTGEVMLIDAGSYTSAVETKVLTYLSDLQLDHIDVTVATHPHSDHIGSLDAVINAYPVYKAYDSGYPYSSISFTDYQNALSSNNVPLYIARRGDTFSLSSDLFVEVLSPTDTIVNTTSNTNDVSIMLRVTYGSTSFIFTGDANQPQELEVINEGYNLEGDVLKVGHHGSYGSTAPAFVDAITPETGGVILCGEDNPYGHPHQDTLDTLNAKNVPIYRVDLDGAMNGDIVMTSNGTTVTVN